MSDEDDDKFVELWKNRDREVDFVVEKWSGRLCLRSGDGYGSITLNQHEAAQLRDALTRWLESAHYDDPR